MKRALRRHLAVFLLAVQFMTRLPVPAADLYTASRFRDIPGWFAGVGVLVGAITGLVFFGLAHMFPPLLAAALSTGFGMLVTGCLHEDGLADLCDGLGSGQPRERVLEIMRDSRIGTFGTAGLGLVVGCKILALGAMPPAIAAIALVAGHSMSRAACTLVMGLSDYVRQDGRGSGLNTGITPVVVAKIAMFGIPVVVLAMVAAGFWPPLAGLAGVGAASLTLLELSRRRLGGYTGDVLGAVQQISELGFLLGMLACL